MRVEGNIQPCQTDTESPVSQLWSWVCDLCATVNTFCLHRSRQGVLLVHTGSKTHTGTDTISSSSNISFHFISSWSPTLTCRKGRQTLTLTSLHFHERKWQQSEAAAGKTCESTLFPLQRKWEVYNWQARRDKRDSKPSSSSRRDSTLIWHFQ